ncbi:type I restriction enzyme, S subunit [Candidatus Magnetomoraceae bacterium gMMP-1]
MPKDWIVSKFGYVKTVLTDYTANGSFADLKKNVVYRDNPSHARLVRLTDLRKNLDNENGVWIDESAYNYLSKSALFGGEFLLANVGAYAGLFFQMPEYKGNASLAPNMFMAKFDNLKILREFMAYVGQSSGVNKQLRLNATASSAQHNMVVSTGFAVIRPNIKLFNGYAAYALRTSGFISEVVARSVGVSYPAINSSDLMNIKIPLPNLSEQKNIANFLDRETAKIDKLIQKFEAAIKLMQERRTALISAAVTGKIDVRNWQAPE